MYEKFFGFTTKPFQTIPNPEVFYPSPKHENALTYLEYGLMERTGFILLTGEIGSGKTTLIKYLLNKIESEIDVAVLFNTNVNSEQLIGMILNEFELVQKNGGKADALDVLYRYLIEKYAQNRRVLLIIDEAQNLSRVALEEVRMLSNLQSDDQMLIQIMLVGQPELRTKIRKPNLAQLNQRITVAYHIPALTREETAEYISFRLEKAGGKPDLFSNDAMDLIYATSGGIPRTINIICDTALVYAYADDLKAIHEPVIRQVVDDREGLGLAYPSPEWADREHTQKNDAVSKRIEAIEGSIHRLQTQVEKRVVELEKSALDSKDELIRQYKDNFEREQAKNKRIVAEYTKLREKYTALLEQSSDAPSGMTQVQENSSLPPVDISSQQHSQEADTFQHIRSLVQKEAEEALRELNAHQGKSDSKKGVSLKRLKKNKGP